jgi:hypothetical protein
MCNGMQYMFAAHLSWSPMRHRQCPCRLAVDGVSCVCPVVAAAHILGGHKLSLQ